MMGRFSEAINKWGFRIMFPPAAIYAETVRRAIELEEVCAKIATIADVTRVQVYDRIVQDSGESIDSLLETAAMMHVDAMLGVPWSHTETDDE